jgi:hypothetical protein
MYVLFAFNVGWATNGRPSIPGSERFETETVQRFVYLPETSLVAFYATFIFYLFLFNAQWWFEGDVEFTIASASRFYSSAQPTFFVFTFALVLPRGYSPSRPFHRSASSTKKNTALPIFSTSLIICPEL